MFPPRRKPSQTKKQYFRRAEEQKIEKQRFRRGGNAFLLIIQNILIANRWTLLVGRAANNKAHAERQMEELRKEFAP